MKQLHFILSIPIMLKLMKKNLLLPTKFGNKKITSSIQYKNLYGVQFHPEKSGKNGIKIVKISRSN